MRLPDGAYSRVPAWTSRRYYLEAILPAAVRRGRDVLRRHHIAPVTFLRVMALHAQHADDDSGRGCTIDVEHLRREAGCSERTVQRARAAARELGVATEVVRGRHLTLEERIEAYDRGSKQRGFASVYALGCPSWLARALPQRFRPVSVDPQVTKAVGERGTPPVGTSVETLGSSRSVVSSAASADALAPLEAFDTSQGASPSSRERGLADEHDSWPEVVTGPRPISQRRRHSPSSAKRRWLEQRIGGGGPAVRPRRRPSYHPDALRLATEVRRNVPALRGVGLGRLIPAHTRFAVGETPWSADQLVRTAFRVAKAKGWSTQAARIRQPAAWWAGLLDGIDSSGQGPSSEAATPSPRSGTDGSSGRSAQTPSQCHWDAARQDHDHEAAELRRRDRTAAHALELARRSEERDERAGINLCRHGVGGRGPDLRAARCAHCRHEAQTTTSKL